MKTRTREIIESGDALFSKRAALTSLWDEMALQFYPERADFTVQRHVGTDFATHLMSSYPLIARRELANSFSSMLRPSGRPWFKLKVQDEELGKDPEARAWLDWAGGVMRRAMYDRPACFVRATKEGDHDFATFGQTVIQPSYNANMDGLLYRTWHLRDVVWCENAELQIDTLHRKAKYSARVLVKMFPSKVDAKVRDKLAREPHCEINCRHIVMPSEDYDLANPAQRKRQPFVSLWIDVDHETILEEVGVPDLGYVIPRWQTVSGSQYAHSPATVAALPDARLLQSITLTLLEAGQKAVDPPMVAVQEAIVGGVNVYAGGVTYVDAEYDERLGEVLRQLGGDNAGRGLAFGVETAQDIREMISQAFFLNKINLPEPGKDMTAYEVQKRMDEYVRGALPLFEPAESEYNGALCDQTMKLLIRANAFGAPDTIPEMLRGADVEFAFELPLQSAAERVKAEQFMESANLLKVAAEASQMNDGTFDINRALRDAIEGIGAPALWLRPPEAVAQMAEEQAEAQEGEQMMGQVAQGAMVAEQVGNAAQSLQGAGILPADMGAAA